MSKDIVDEYAQSVADLLSLKRVGAKNTRALNQSASVLVDKIVEYTGKDRGDVVKYFKEKQKDKESV